MKTLLLSTLAIVSIMTLSSCHSVDGHDRRHHRHGTTTTTTTEETTLSRPGYGIVETQTIRTR